MSDNKIVDFMQVKAEMASRIEEIDKAVDDSDKEIADPFAQMQAKEIVYSLKEMGIDIRNDVDCILDVLCIIEIIKAMIYRTVGEDHPFQLLSNGVFDKIDFSKQDVMDEFLSDMEEYFDGLEE